MKIKHIRSLLTEGGKAKAPTASQLDYGEIAVNYNEDDPALFIKDETNQVVRLDVNAVDFGSLGFQGSVDVTSDTTPFNAALYNQNDLYVNTAAGKFSATWAAITENADETTDAAIGDFMAYDGSEWTHIPSGGASSDGLWLETGGKLSPATLTNDVLIGGVDAAAATIQLNTDGSATFAGNFFTFGDLNHQATEASQSGVAFRYGAIKTKRNDSSTFALWQGTNVPGTITSEIKGDGSATFAGNLTSKKIYINADSTHTDLSKPWNNYALELHNRDATVDNNYVALGFLTKSTNGQDTSTAAISAETVSHTHSAVQSNLRFYTAYDNTLYSRAILTNEGTFGVGGTLPDDPNISLKADGSATFAGKVGIGTNSPSELLTLTSTSGTGTAIRLENGSIGGYDWGIYSMGTEASLAPAGSLAFRDSTNGVTRFVIDPSGNVGIGTDSPEQRLHVVNPGDNGGEIQIGSSKADFGASRLTLYGLNNHIAFRHSGVGGGEDLSYVFGGPENIGITSEGFLSFGTRPIAGDVSERMRIDSSGNVKIIGGGTVATPQITLNANGSATFAGNIGIYASTSSVTPNITLNADGSATFAGNLTSKKIYINADSTHTDLSKPWNNYALELHNRDATVDNNYVALGFLTKSTNGQDTSTAAISAETVSHTHSAVQSNLRFYTAYDNTLYSRAILTNEGTFGVGGTLPDDPNISLKADGSATFAGTVTIDNSTTTNSLQGLVVRNKDSRAALPTLELQNKGDKQLIIGSGSDGSVTFNVDSDGSAGFSGTVSAAKFNLEALTELT